MVNIRVLQNGLRVVMEEIPHVRSISFGIWVYNGTRNEPEALNGISHFIEHMLFKGTETRSGKDIAEEMDAVGGQINAYTTKEYTCYHTRVLDKHFDQAVDVMSDMFLRSRFLPEDIEKEANVILEEINMYDDAPEEVVHDALQEQVWAGVPLGMPILGREETIKRFRREDFLNYMAENYQPENTVLSMAGNFKEEEMMQKLEHYFGAWKPKAPFLHRHGETAYTPSLVLRKKDIEQVHLCLAFPAFPRDSAYKYALTVFNTIFGGGMSSRLFQKVREENGLTYSVYSYTSAYLDAGLFVIYAGMSKNQTEQALALILKEIAEVKENGIPEALVNKTKEQIISNFILGNESTVNRMTGAGGSVLLRNSVKTTEEVIAEFEAVKPEDIKQMVEVIFDAKKASLSAAGNIDGIPFSDLLLAIREGRCGI